jgi:thiol-disulfide isomerase/thioredoxin
MRLLINCFLLFMVLSTGPGLAQAPRVGIWQFVLSRQGGIPVLVDVEFNRTHTAWEWVFLNDTERLTVQSPPLAGDSLHFEMPLFETRFALQLKGDSLLSGSMLKGTSGQQQAWDVRALYGKKDRHVGKNEHPATDIGGRWALEFQRADGSWRPAVAAFRQSGSRVSGTVINPSGDYRYLQGTLHGSQLYLSTFDGAHIYAFTAIASGDSLLESGQFFSGSLPITPFRARRNASAQLPATPPVAELKPGAEKLNFRFPDLDSNLTGIEDARFRGKVTILQIMGSWCPNCMDETRFLSDFYNSQTSRDVEIVALAYELSTDFKRSANSLRKFQQRFNVRYPMLITGARSADADKAAKTLPQLTDIKYFPTTLFIDKAGRVRKIHSGFYGPGAPEYFEAYKKEFFDTLKQLTGE